NPKSILVPSDPPDRSGELGQSRDPFVTRGLGPERRAAEQIAALPDRDRRCKRWRHRCLSRERQPAAGPVAQWLEPAAHNGLVAGSSPAGPTSGIRCLSILIFSAPPELLTQL